MTKDEILSRFPEPITLYPSRLKWAGFAALSLTFVAAGVWLIKKPEPTLFHLFMCWSGIVLFGLMFVTFCIQLLPGACSLILSRKQFEIISLYRHSLYPWSSAERFRVWERKLPGTPRMMQVVFDNLSRKSALQSFLIGGQTSLPDTFGLEAETLAEIMNRWRERALASNQPL